METETRVQSRSVLLALAFEISLAQRAVVLQQCYYLRNQTCCTRPQRVIRGRPLFSPLAEIPVPLTVHVEQSRGTCGHIFNREIFGARIAVTREICDRCNGVHTAFNRISFR